MRKRINLNDIVVYNQIMRQPRSVMQHLDIDEVVEKNDESEGRGEATNG